MFFFKKNNFDTKMILENQKAIISAINNKGIYNKIDKIIDNQEIIIKILNKKNMPDKLDKIIGFQNYYLKVVENCNKVLESVRERDVTLCRHIKNLMNYLDSFKPKIIEKEDNGNK